MGTCRPQLTSSSLRRFLAQLEGIGDTFNIENHGHTGQNPFEDVVLRLQLGWEDVGLSSGLGLVDRADVDALVFLVTHHDCAAEHGGDNAEVLLRFALFQSIVWIPSGTFDLESKDEGSITFL